MISAELLNYLIEHNGFSSYLEIGCRSDATFNAISCPVKVGVDPISGGTLRMDSDQFFRVNRSTFDLIFIDGLHLAEQVLVDVSCSLRCLSPTGCIVLHDCLPIDELRQQRKRLQSGWCGDVWKAVVTLRQQPDIDTAVIAGGVGHGIVLKRPNTDVLKEVPSPLNWEAFKENKEPLLRIIHRQQLDEFIAPLHFQAPESSSAVSARFGSESPNPIRRYIDFHDGQPISINEQLIEIGSKWLEPRRYKKTSLLQIGYNNEDLLEMWSQYLGPGTHVFGATSEEKLIVRDQWKFVTAAGIDGFQDFELFLQSVFARIGSVNIVIYKATGQPGDMVSAFEIIFPRLLPGGLLLFDCSGFPRFKKDAQKMKPLKEFEQISEHMYSSGDIQNDEVFAANAAMPAGISFYRDICVIEKVNASVG